MSEHVRACVLRGLCGHELIQEYIIMVMLSSFNNQD